MLYLFWVCFQLISSNQSYVIKSAPWTILWFRILEIFSAEYIKRLCVFMFQTCSNSQLLRRVLWISAEETIGASLKHKNTQPLYIFSRVRVLHLNRLKERTWLHSFGLMSYIQVLYLLYYTCINKDIKLSPYLVNGAITHTHICIQWMNETMYNTFSYKKSSPYIFLLLFTNKWGLHFLTVFSRLEKFKKLRWENDFNNFIATYLSSVLIDVI